MKGEIRESGVGGGGGGSVTMAHFNHFYLSPVCVQKQMKPATILLWWYITHNSFSSDKEPPKSTAIINGDVWPVVSHVYLFKHDTSQGMSLPIFLTNSYCFFFVCFSLSLLVQNGQRTIC